MYDSIFSHGIPIHAPRAMRFIDAQRFWGGEYNLSNSYVAPEGFHYERRGNKTILVKGAPIPLSFSL